MTATARLNASREVFRIEHCAVSEHQVAFTRNRAQQVRQISLLNLGATQCRMDEELEAL